MREGGENVHSLSPPLEVWHVLTQSKELNRSKSAVHDREANDQNLFYYPVTFCELKKTP